MQPRGTDALPLPPRANLEQYRNRAKSLLEACRSADGAAVRAWARQWLESLATLTDGATTDLPGRSVERIRRLYRKEIDREVDKIERDARESGLLSDSDTATCSLSGAQLFIARLHDFVSWPRFSAHIEALARADSPDAEFESAADAVVAGEAVAGGEVESPVMEAARQHAVVDLAEAGQVGLAVGTEPFDPPSVTLEELVGFAAAFEVAALDVVDPLR